jgi:chromosome segregation ATPase
MRNEEDSELILFRAEMRAHVGTVNENITKVQEQHHTMLQELVSLRTEFTHVKEDVKDLKFDVNGLVDLKKHGVGFLAAITLTAGILFLGVKSWLGAFLTAVRGGS